MSKLGMATNFFMGLSSHKNELNCLKPCCEYVDWQQTFCPCSCNICSRLEFLFQSPLGWCPFLFCIQDAPRWKLQSSNWRWCNCSLVVTLFSAFWSRVLSLDLFWTNPLLHAKVFFQPLHIHFISGFQLQREIFFGHHECPTQILFLKCKLSVFILSNPKHFKHPIRPLMSKSCIPSMTKACINSLFFFGLNMVTFSTLSLHGASSIKFAFVTSIWNFDHSQLSFATALFWLQSKNWFQIWPEENSIKIDQVGGSVHWGRVPKISPADFVSKPGKDFDWFFWLVFCWEATPQFFQQPFPFFDVPLKKNVNTVCFFFQTTAGWDIPMTIFSLSTMKMVSMICACKTVVGMLQVSASFLLLGHSQLVANWMQNDALQTHCWVSPKAAGWLESPSCKVWKVDLSLCRNSRCCHVFLQYSPWSLCCWRF